MSHSIAMDTNPLSLETIGLSSYIWALKWSVTIDWEILSIVGCLHSLNCQVASNRTCFPCTIFCSVTRYKVRYPKWKKSIKNKNIPNVRTLHGSAESYVDLLRSWSSADTQILPQDRLRVRMDEKEKPCTCRDCTSFVSWFHWVQGEQK